MAKPWTLQENEVLKTHYEHQGIEYCKSVLDRTRNSIVTRASKMKLKVVKLDRTKVSELNSKRSRENIELSIKNMKDYLSINRSEIAYALGFIWGDGTLTKNNNNSLRYVSLEISSDDFDNIYETLKCLETEKYKWKIYTRKRKESWKETTQALLHNMFLGKFLEYYDYDFKSGMSADKLLQYMPQKYHKYFFRGLYDSDGNFLFTDGIGSHRATICSTYDQDWKYVSDYLISIGIPKDATNIQRTVARNGNRYSTIYIGRQKYLNLLFCEVYSDYANDNIGLLRKFQAISKIYKYPKIPHLLKDR